MSNLWNLQFGGTAAMPILTRGESKLTESTTDIKDLTNISVYGDQSKQAKDPINVVQDFAWTNSPKSARYDVPKIQMIEQRLVLNSVVTNIVYSALAGGDVLASGVNTVQGIGDRLGDIFKTAPAGNTTEEKAVAAEKNSIVGAVRGFYENALDAGSFKTFDSEVLRPYEGLYATEYTGFNYYFPYLDDSYRDIVNQFGDSQNTVLGPIAEFVSGTTAGLAGIANAVKPGTYIEKAKQFTMGDSGRTLNFSLPLLNTGTFEDVRRNWQLIFGLVYQNRPGRVSKSIIDQPVIYEVHIPGVAYMPYAYISGLSVKFLGNRREMEFSVPIMDEGVNGGNTNNIGNIKTIIPDAYELNITIQGLNEETRNLIYASVKKDKLTVNSPIDSADPTGTPQPVTTAS